MNANELFRRHLFGAPGRKLLPVEVIGLSNLPAEPFVLYAGPHKSWRDTVELPMWLQDYEIHFLAKSILFKIPLVGLFLKRTGQIPVHRGDRRAASSVDAAVEDLEKGFNVAVFFEGTRYKKDPYVHKGKTGAVRSALLAGVPLVPVALVGVVDSDIPTRIIIGKPFNPNMLLTAAEKQLGKRQQETILARRVTDYLAKQVAKLGGLEYVG